MGELKMFLAGTVFGASVASIIWWWNTHQSHWDDQEI